MRIHKDDTLLLVIKQAPYLYRVAKFTQGRISLVPVADARTRDKGLLYVTKSPAAIRTLQARPVGVDVLGYVNDPGFKE